MSEEDINRAVREAEQYAAEDKKRKEEVELHNNAESIIYQTEKTLNELGDKLNQADKEKVQAELENLKKAKEGGDTETLKAALEKLSQVSMQVFGSVYQQAQGQADPNGGFNGAGPGAGFNGGQPGNGGNNDGSVDADYEVKN
jgi:molecular chaperone DnaK